MRKYCCPVLASIMFALFLRCDVLAIYSPGDKNCNINERRGGCDNQRDNSSDNAT